MSSAEFYRDLKPFRRFVENAINDSYYAPVPDDWLVAVADVVSSTGAVKAGRYAEVNYLGAACIVAAGNSVPEILMPSVFGGDGATLVIPPEARDRVCAALLATKQWGKASFGLDLRVGIVSMADLKRHGASLYVAKMQFSPGNDMAMFRGNALDLADKLVKEGDDGRSYELGDEGVLQQPDLNTLSCRWEPLLSENGTMLCVLATACSPSIDESDAVYSILLSGINGIVRLDEAACSPIKLSNTRFRFPSWGIVREAKSRPGPWWLNLVRVTAFHLFMYVVDRFRINVGDFDPQQYRQELTVNADFRKLKGSLSLVVDCNEAQAREIESLLKQMHDAGQIFYGTHRTSHAIMTCVVPSATDHEHVHFIDGGDGGFWSASEGLKAQVRGAS
ncbi:MAG: DUF3095 family protein [Gammaproteobacteria bacterium]|nr:DUF3095 family protein [Gammaproteobacteria bacterium]